MADKPRTLLGAEMTPAPGREELAKRIGQAFKREEDADALADELERAAQALRARSKGTTSDDIGPRYGSTP